MRNGLSSKRKMMHNILLAGDNGFIGKHLTPYLTSRGYNVIGADGR